MILTRQGNKRRICEKILQHFPPHDAYIEPFFGAGGILFNKRKAKYNIVNDIDAEVFNLFMVLKSEKQRFIEELANTPYSEDLWKYWKTSNETDPVQKAVRFLAISNWGYMGSPETLRFGINNSKKDAIEKVEWVSTFLQDVQFMNCDFRDLFKKIAFRKLEDKQRYFVYADPPYIGTDDNYSHSFIEKDFTDLLDLLIEHDIRFAVSEFDTPFVMEEAKKRRLNIFTIGERNNLKNRRVEIMITNYLLNNTLF